MSSSRCGTITSVDTGETHLTVGVAVVGLNVCDRFELLKCVKPSVSKTIAPSNVFCFRTQRVECSGGRVWREPMSSTSRVFRERVVELLVVRNQEQFLHPHTSRSSFFTLRKQQPNTNGIENTKCLVAFASDSRGGMLYAGRTPDGPKITLSLARAGAPETQQFLPTLGPAADTHQSTSPETAPAC